MYSDARDLHLMVELTVCCLSLIDGDIDIGESLSKNIPSFSSRWSIDNEAILRFYCSIFFLPFTIALLFEERTCTDQNCQLNATCPLSHHSSKKFYAIIHIQVYMETKIQKFFRSSQKGRSWSWVVTLPVQPRAGVLGEIPSINKPFLYLRTAKAGKESREAHAW